MRKTFIFTAVVVLIAVSFALPIAAETNKQVFAFYYGWWTPDAWESEQVTDAPFNLYDVRDPQTAVDEIAAAQAVGLDGFIVDWLGLENDNVTHQSLLNLLEAANDTDFKIAVIVDMSEPMYLGNQESLDAALTYLMTDIITQPSYLHLDGRPVVYFWNEERFTLGMWMTIRAQYDPYYTQSWMMEGTNQAYLPTFDGMYMLDVAWADNPVEAYSFWQDRVENLGAQFFQPTVLPGWDASAFAGWDSTISPPRERENGELLNLFWNAATITENSNVILVNSWNGFYENSHVVPSINYGTQSSELLQDLITTWKAS